MPEPDDAVRAWPVRRQGPAPRFRRSRSRRKTRISTQSCWRYSSATATRCVFCFRTNICAMPIARLKQTDCGSIGTSITSPWPAPGEWEPAPGTSFAVSSQMEMEILRASSGSERRVVRCLRRCDILRPQRQATRPGTNPAFGN